MVSTVNDIRLAAIEQLGVADAIVNRYEQRPAKTIGYKHHDPSIDETGVWQMLFIKQTADSAWEAIGRRRTRAELVSVIENYGRRVFTG